MLLILVEWLSGFWEPLGVFRYLTLRSLVAAMTSLLLALLLGPRLIRWLLQENMAQKIREHGPKTHAVKSGTPTMGGAMILVAMAISTLLWADLKNAFVWMALLATLGFGAIGFADDWRKVKRGKDQGLSAKEKYFWQSLLAIVAALWLWHIGPDGIFSHLWVPFIKNPVLALGPAAFVVIAYFVIVGASNAVNLTDGLDGLAIMPAVLVAGGLAVFAYAEGNKLFAQYLLIPYVPGAGEVAVFCATLGGAGLGFLWFNAYPAQVFMGDVGALALGAALGIIALVVRQEIVLFLMGGLFVAETVSVMAQVLSFKTTGKRIFKMAPLHHHFELLGWKETQVVVRFWIVSMLFVLLGLATLKLR